MRMDFGRKTPPTGARLAAPAALLLLCATLAGCRIDTHKDGKNNNNDVKFATPFGGMSVKTNDADVQQSVGLSVYPGAVVVRKENSKDSDAADINMSFGSFHLGVKALSYQTSDPPEKVKAFYRNDMARYGVVIECHNNEPVGQPARTPEGLGCSDEQKAKIEVDHGAQSEFKAGSRQHQHIVSVDPKNGGTRIGLVLLDLPTGAFRGEDDSRQ